MSHVERSVSLKRNRVPPPHQVPVYHIVWHVFVMVASLMHWFAVFHYTVHYEVPKPISS